MCSIFTTFFKVYIYAKKRVGSQDRRGNKASLPSCFKHIEMLDNIQTFQFFQQVSEPQQQKKSSGTRNEVQQAQVYVHISKDRS